MELVYSGRMYLFCVLWIFISLCGISGVKSIVDINKDAFLTSLDDYEIITPSRVNNDGQHLTFTLHPGHSLRRRSADTVQSDDIIHYNVFINNEAHTLKLKQNNKLITPGLVIERKQSQFKNVTDSKFSYIDGSKTKCHFHGEIAGKPGTRVAVGLCNGMHGFIHTATDEYFIQPLEETPWNSDGQHRHVIYKRSALPKHLDPIQLALEKQQRDEDGDGTCGVKDHSDADNRRERWEKHHRRKRETVEHHRSKRSFSTERYVETLIVVDPSMIKYHKNEHLETYVLTIMNMVAAMFHDATIGNFVNIALVRILLLEEDQEELVITHHADKTLQSFCKFQKSINFKDDDHPNHHDVAILFTRKNICSRLNEPCGTLGLAQVSGMCQPHRSCSISEDTGLALAYTVAHEIGHNFGMKHDGSSNGCEDPPGKQLFIMSPSLVADSLRKSWSNCSKQSITQFIDRDWGYCLDDEPASHDYNYPVLPPGTMYDANHQCRLQYGTDDAEICTNEQDVCSNLWCRTDNRCTTRLEAAAEGTICGDNKWCYQGKCVKIGDRPEAINGEWGVWTSWSDCTRTCGAGVSHSQRHCDNPAPSHGGKYCLGERKRYRICNTEDCQSDVTFNEMQCEEFDYIPYKGKLYQWQHVQTSETPCQLHCKPKDHFFSVLMKDIASDGTPCTPGTRNMCISGRCRHVGCDYVIDSRAREDRCGVCHGDGSTCKTIKSQFNESQGLGYVEAAVIPKGARNIRVEEVAAASNFLALQNSEGEYYLNGHWFIQWSGDYQAAGTTIQYNRVGNKESVQATGPLKEPLHVMLLLQSNNPGVKFEYTIPKDNITETRKPEFHWRHQPWTHCTSSCGGGKQRSEVVCLELEAGVVDDKYCNVTTKPDDMQRVCNEHLCPARWWTGTWQHCSVTCGNNGVHHRTVICVRSLGPDEQIALDDDACVADDKPAETEACHKKEPCPGNSTWIVGAWSSCNGNLCGQKYRKVECKDASIGCEQNKIPVSEMPCSDRPCGEYVTSEWTRCTRSCGEGIQTRQVVCEGADFCDTSTKPESQRHCNVAPCLSVTSTTPSTTRTTQQIIHSSKNTNIGENQDQPSESSSDKSTSKDYAIQVEDYTNARLKTESKTDDSSTNTVTKTENSGKTSAETKYKTKENGEESSNEGDRTIDSKELIASRKSIAESTSGEVDENGEGNLFNIPQESETHHKHRHHHGQEHMVINVEADQHDSSEEFDIVEEDYTHTDVKNSEISGTDKTQTTKQPDREDANKINSEKIDKLYVPDLKDLPLLPTNKKLPSLPDINDLPPLPNLNELPPINSAELDKLPDLGKLPSLGDLPPFPGPGHLTDKKFPSESNSYLNHNVQSKKSKDDSDFMEFNKDGGNTDTDSSNDVHPMNSFNLTDNLPLDKLPFDNTRPVTNNDIDVDKSDINFKSNISKIDKQNISLGSESRILSGKGPVLSRVQMVDQQGGFKWMPLDWSECSRNCGGGVRTRVVECLNSEDGSEVEQMLCDINTKPTAIEDCNKRICQEWQTSQWGECSSQCGESVRKRLVSCTHEGSCDPKHKPSSEEICDVPKCVMWVSGQWSKCTKPCGGGEQLRLVQCVNKTTQRPSHGCDYHDKPGERQECNVEPCKQNNAALSVRCLYNEISSSLCRALKKMGQCQNRFIALKCCKTCSAESHRRANKDRPKGSSLR